MAELSLSTKELVSKYVIWQKSLKPKEGANTVHVDEVASRVAAFYEQIRTIIDWKEEHLMRRAAIIRKLQRRFFNLELNNFYSNNIAEPLLMELIRGGYFSNDKIEESKIEQVQKIIDKYVFILKNDPGNKKGKADLNFYNKLLEIAACEVEEKLAPSIKEMALIDYMFYAMQERIKVNEVFYSRGSLKKEDKDIQIYIAVQQALFKLDNPIISYNLLRHKYLNWDNPTQEELLKISQNIRNILNVIAKDFSHPLGKKFYVICEKYDTPYLLLGDVLALGDNVEKTAQEISDPPFLEEQIKKSYAKRLFDLKAKITRAAVYSTASIFITKILSLLIIEFILAKIFSNHISILALAADVIVPTGLMGLLVASAKPPPSKNLQLAVMETIKIAYQKDKVDSYEIKVAKSSGSATKFFLSFIYLIGAVLSFGFLYSVFRYFQFPLTSIIIDFIFIALILFAGNAIQKRSQELTIEEESEGLLGFVFDILLLPITDLGRWLSNKWKKYNVIALFFNALVDMPFSAFVEFLELWRYFIKEKKEELR